MKILSKNKLIFYFSTFLPIIFSSCSSIKEAYDSSYTGMKETYHKSNARVVYYRTNINAIPDAVATASSKLGMDDVKQTKSTLRELSFEGSKITVMCEKNDDKVKMMIRFGYGTGDKEQEEIFIEELDKILGDNIDKKTTYNVSGRKIVVESVVYNDSTQQGTISINIGDWDLKEARAWGIENIRQIAATKNVLLKSGIDEIKSPASFKTLGESVTNGILTIEFKAEY